MTFAEIVSAVQSRLNLTSTESATRIGITVNDRYKRITSAIGINLSRRTTVQANVTVGVSTLNFAACEKVINVVDRSATPYRVLTECTVEQLRAEQPSSNATPRKYAILAVDAHSVTILLDCVPQTAFTLYADCYGRASTLSGSQEPAFEEDFHDVLLHGALADEYRKMEKPAYARESESLYQERLSDLRMFRTKSSYLDIMQGGNSRRSLGVSGGSGGSGSSTNGASSYTQTGLITFDRTSAAPGLRYPFAVAVGSEKVANLDADKLDGLDSTAFRLAATQITESDITLADVTTLDVSTTKHGLTPKAPNLNTQVLVGTGAWGASGQLVFPAVQNASANVNTLDDYEEGSWTPTIISAGGGIPTYTIQVGRYVKVGQDVFLSGHIKLATFGTLAAGAVTIGGLPFTSLNVTDLYGTCQMAYWAVMTTPVMSISGIISPNTVVITVIHAAAATVTLSVTQKADMAATTEWIFSARFLTAS